MGPQFGPGQEVPTYMHAGEQAGDWWKVLNTVLYCVYHKLMLVSLGLTQHVCKKTYPILLSFGPTLGYTKMFPICGSVRNYAACLWHNIFDYIMCIPQTDADITWSDTLR